ncbi:tyrosine-type recombinase/integrase [Aquisediminimonas sediminicola]|uniref:tyrosine-type recombinase/integrase n=1 Tax=Alteraquisediminimonas sediminicola TaxID=2676787 RepID=UPI001C8DEE50|nr:integrase arm-type DNA-binding domain-containing protein [Aquisediminimonas sediminicola]
MALSDVKIRTLKKPERDTKIADEKGLFLLHTKSGSKLWRFKYRYQGKEKLLALGSYPEVGLATARARRDDARTLLADGIDPSAEKRRAAVAAAISAATTFGSVAHEYIDKTENEGRADATIRKSRWLLSLLEPALGKRPISEITPQELLETLKKIERRGNLESAGRARALAGRTFRYAVATARASHDPAALLKGALLTPVVKHHAALIDPKEVGALLRAIDGYEGHPATIKALQLTPHIFQRPGEVRKARWADIDLDNAVWAIPAEQMKKRQPHFVPLSRQAVSILQDMKSLTGSGQYVFPSIRSLARPMSENTVNAALRRLGYANDEMTAHGFRTTASSLLNESGKWNPDAIERALSHAEKSQSRRAYNRTPYWDERVAMAQWWSDFLDTLKAGADIIPLFKAG